MIVEKIFVLDSSAILSGKPLSGEMVTSPLIIKEFRRGQSYRSLNFLLMAGMRILSPSKSSLEKIENGAEKTGDEFRLSKADKEILALALELSDEKDRKVILLTDDYSMQNLAKKIGIEYLSVSQEGIKEEFHWILRCTGCGRFFKKKMKKCPICGSELKTVRK
jgi:UPF0271 protein